jgi:Tol biopolymer transport system component
LTPPREDKGPFSDGPYPGAWTPDNRALVFAVETAGTGLDILTLTPDGKTDVTPFLQTPYQEANPALSPDGRELYYWKNGRMMATAATAVDSTATNLSPNRVEALVPEIRVVTGWFEELRRKR